MMRASIGVLLFAAILGAQSQAPKSPAALENDWDIAAVLKEIGDHAGRLLPTLDKIQAAAWVEKGASETYGVQLQSCKEQVKAISAGARALAANPQKLSAALELFFRIQGVESMLNSLQDGVRKYQSPSDAQALARLVAENGGNRDRLQHYIVNLAAEREQDLQVMDREAQRCRSLLTQAPPKSGRKK